MHFGPETFLKVALNSECALDDLTLSLVNYCQCDADDENCFKDAYLFTVSRSPSLAQLDFF